MSLFKVPLILSYATALHVSLTPPSTLSRNEVVHNTSNERTLHLHTKYWLPFEKVLNCSSIVTIFIDELCPQSFYWGISLAEIAIIASRAAGSSVLPNMIQHAVGPLLGRIQDTPMTSPFLSGTALVVTGGLIRWWCFRILGPFFTFELSVRKGHQLVTTGPYAVVRHPSYAGGMLQLIGVLILYGSRTSWLRDSGILDTIPALQLVVLIWVVEKVTRMVILPLRVSQEDKLMKAHFGDEWKRWAKVVRYRLIPGIY
jgi:protein-S-isoprenylcysteine O-methyltransferase Ste14